MKSKALLQVDPLSRGKAIAPRATVPCGSCRACCNELIILHPEDGDDPSAYLTRTVKHPLTGQPVPALLHKPDGNCFYLGKEGCTIHERAPILCREFDCRRAVLNLKRKLGSKNFKALLARSPTLQRGLELVGQ